MAGPLARLQAFAVEGTALKRIQLAAVRDAEVSISGVKDPAVFHPDIPTADPRS
jgi:hypothetical protein